MQRQLSFSIESILDMPSRASRIHLYRDSRDGGRCSTIDNNSNEVDSTKTSFQNQDSFYSHPGQDTTESEIKTLLSQMGTVGNNSEKIAKRQLNEFQKRRLEDIFVRKQYITPLEILKYSEELELSEVQIRNWFQNKRTRMRSCGIKLVKPRRKVIEMPKENYIQRSNHHYSSPLDIRGLMPRQHVVCSSKEEYAIRQDSLCYGLCCKGNRHDYVKSVLRSRTLRKRDFFSHPYVYIR